MIKTLLNSRLLLQVLLLILLLLMTSTIMFIYSYTINTIVFTLFFVIIYYLRIYKILNLFFILIISLIFDSTVGLSLGTSYILILFTSTLYELEKALLKNDLMTSLSFRYLLSLMNLILMFGLQFGLNFIIPIKFINFTYFCIVTAVAIIVVWPISVLLLKLYSSDKK